MRRETLMRRDHGTRFTALWVQAQPVVANYLASHVNNREMADDLLQEVAVALYESFERFDPTRAFLPWAIGTARKRMLSELRKRRNEKVIFENEETLLVLAKAHERMAPTFPDRAEALRHCLGACPPKVTRLINLRYRRQLSFSEMGRVLRTNGANVRTMLSRAREALRKCVRRRLRSVS